MQSLFLIMSLFLGSLPLLHAGSQTEEQISFQITSVIPNKIGKARINFSQTNQELPISEIPCAEEIGIEFITDQQTPEQAIAKHLWNKTSLPFSVDNSELPFFPPIKNYENNPILAITCYQIAHEIGLLHGYNLRNLSEDLDSYSEIPMMVGKISDDLQDLTAIKQMLNNGHILTFSTCTDDWQINTISYNLENGVDNRFAGQKIVSHINPENQAHPVAIVGYNDRIWIDTNQNGKVNPEEMGAFLVLTSHGTTWGNGGLIWISYNAFLSRPTLPNSFVSACIPFSEPKIQFITANAAPVDDSTSLPKATTNEKLAITSPLENSVVACLLAITVSVPEPVRWVYLAVDNLNAGYSLTPPYTIMLDTTQWPNGLHTLAVGSDKTPFFSTKPVHVQIQNGCN